MEFFPLVRIPFFIPGSHHLAIVAKSLIGGGGGSPLYILDQVFVTRPHPSWTPPPTAQSRYTESARAGKYASPSTSKTIILPSDTGTRHTGDFFSQSKQCMHDENLSDTRPSTTHFDNSSSGNTN